MTPKPGQRVVVTFPDVDPPTAYGTVLEGPIWQGGRAVFRVQVEETDGPVVWVPMAWLAPMLRVV